MQYTVQCTVQYSTVQYSCQRDAHRPGATIPHWYTDQPPCYTSVLYIRRVGDWW